MPKEYREEKIIEGIGNMIRDFVKISPFSYAKRISRGENHRRHWKHD